MKKTRVMLILAITALDLSVAVPGFAEQAGSSCPPELAQARAIHWAVQTAMDIAKAPTLAPGQGALESMKSMVGGAQSAGGWQLSRRAQQELSALVSDQDLKAFVAPLSEQERRLLYQTLSGPERKRLASTLSEKERKGLTRNLSDEEVKAWANQMASDQAGLNEAIQEATALIAAAQALCDKGDSTGAAAKAKEAIFLHRPCRVHPCSWN